MVSTAGGIVIAVVVLLVAAAVGWIVFTQLRARRLGVCRMLGPLSLLLPTRLVDLYCPSPALSLECCYGSIAIAKP